MKTYTALFAFDVPYYGSVEIQASSDTEAIEKAKACDLDCCDDPDWSSITCKRIVEIGDEHGKIVAEAIAIDECFLRYGGEADRLLCDAAPDLLRGLDTAIQILNRIAEVLHYEDSLPVTFLEARELQDLYADAIGQTDELQAILIRARGSK